MLPFFTPNQNPRSSPVASMRWSSPHLEKDQNFFVSCLLKSHSFIPPRRFLNAPQSPPTCSPPPSPPSLPPIRTPSFIPPIPPPPSPKLDLLITPSFIPHPAPSRLSPNSPFSTCLHFILYTSSALSLLQTLPFLHYPAIFFPAVIPLH